MAKTRAEFEVPNSCLCCRFFDDECMWCTLFDTAVFYNKNKDTYERCDKCKQAEAKDDYEQRTAD